MQSDNVKNNGVFCIMPWTHLAVRTTGTVRPCSWVIDELRMEDGSAYSVEKDGIDDYSSKYPIRKLKENMLNGDPSYVCERCYEQEKLNGVSKRTKETFEIQRDKTEQLLQTGDVPISQLELRLGNKCNIGCITCDPWSSSFLVKELDRNHNQPVNDLHKNYLRKYHDVKDSPLNWYEDPKFWKELETHFPNLDYVYIAGGEPSIIKENWEFLQRLVDLGYSKNIMLGVSTNLTTVKSEHIEIYKNFKNVQLYCSLDAYGDLNDYIRYPSKWKVVSKNFKYLAENVGDSNIELMLMPVISIFSIWQFEKLWDWAHQLREETGANITVRCHTLLRDPQYQSMFHMPDDLKKKALGVVESIKNKYQDKFSQVHLKRVEEYLENSLGQGDVSIFESGKKFTEIMDRMRGLDWRNYVPELKEGWD